MTSYIAGSWFPSGFHGNFRSSARNDILQEYRHEARPQPPALFLQRMRENPKKHLFTKHDNERVISSTIKEFNSGMVKARLSEKSRHPYNFLEWAPLVDELKRQRPLLTTYQSDFWRLEDTTSDKRIPQLLVPRITQGISASRPPSSTYQHTFRGYMPIRNGLADSFTSRNHQECALKESNCVLDAEKSRASLNGSKRALSAPPARMTVSDCLVWPTGEFTQTTLLPV